MSDHPWADLTKEEFEEMVDFCQEYFTAAWTWEKGCWCVDILGDICLIIDITSEGPELRSGPIQSQRVWYQACGLIPLPLAHQWDEVAYRQGVWSIHEVSEVAGKNEFPSIVYQSDTLNSGEHPNPHYRRYLAFRKVIEDEHS